MRPTFETLKTLIVTFARFSSQLQHFQGFVLVMARREFNSAINSGEVTSTLSYSPSTKQNYVRNGFFLFATIIGIVLVLVRFEFTEIGALIKSSQADGGVVAEPALKVDMKSEELI